MPEGITISPQPSEVGSISVRDVVRAFTGTTTPTVDYDITAGYIVGDIRINEATDISYQCMDNTDGAAVWEQISATGASVSAHSIASHNDTTATGTELETLTDGSDADLLHAHAVNDTASHTQGTDTALGAVGTVATPDDADKVIYRDAGSSDVLVTSTWTQVKAFLKTYFDTLYNKYVHPNHSGEVTSAADGAQTIVNKQTLSATSPITLSNTPTVVAGAAPVIAIPAATNAIPGHATAAQITALETATLFRRHTLESGDDLIIGEDEQKVVHSIFTLKGTSTTTINGTGELVVL